ncbi:heme-dependent catalase [Thozetella sp. PMI_491]|nr:heme-dependent catalase [Thozetella sp. PMI_491]
MGQLCSRTLYFARLSPASIARGFLSERVNARDGGAYGMFISYGNLSNLTAASFLAQAGKTTPVFVRFSTVAGSRGSTDSARDIHGFATRFYMKETLSDDYTSCIVSGYARLWHHSQLPPNDDGSTKLIKRHWKTKQGRASFLGDEAQVLSGKNPDYHRQDLFDAMYFVNGPEWELDVQIIDEEQDFAFGSNVLDATKIIPEELAPLHKLGIMKLYTNRANYFAETEQIMVGCDNRWNGVRRELALGRSNLAISYGE